MANVDDLIALMDRWPSDKDGNTALARHLWGYNMWTRAQMLRDLVAYLTAIGVTDQSSLRRWAGDATFDSDFKGRVRGLGPAVFQWLVMCQGVDTVKPDVHVHWFIVAILGRPVSDTEAIELIVSAARPPGTASRLGHLGSRPAGTPPPSVAAESVRVPNPHSVGTTAAEPTEDVDPAIVSFIDDDPGYLAWITAHPDGYVLNCERAPSPRYLMLHLAS